MKTDLKAPESTPEALLAVACTFCSKSIGQRMGRRRTATPSSPPSQPVTPQSPLSSPPSLSQPPSTTGGTAGSTTSSGGGGGSSSVVGGKNNKQSSDTDIDTCNCRKPRARCALCLSRLNTAASLALFKTNGRICKTRSLSSPGSNGSSKNTSNSSPSPRFPFSSFTVFCATCRHSGHALHYLEWFSLNTNCPVAGCTCTCDKLDSIPSRILTETTKSG